MHIPRPSKLDLVSALCWNESYTQDYEGIRTWMERVNRNEINLLSYGLRDGKRKFRPMEPSDDANKAASEISSFLDRWPQIRLPIPPELGRKNPDNYLNSLCDAAEVVPHDSSPGKRGLGFLIDAKSWKFGSSHNITEGRFLTVRIDLTRSAEEILESLKYLIDGYQRDWEGFGIALPRSTARMSKQKKGPADRWEAYRVFMGKGGQDQKRTAEILFPASFRYKNDKKEVKAELDEWLLKQKGPGGKIPPKILAAYDTKLSKMTCSTRRRNDRKTKEKWVVVAVKACKYFIEAQSSRQEK